MEDVYSPVESTLLSSLVLSVSLAGSVSVGLGDGYIPPTWFINTPLVMDLVMTGGTAAFHLPLLFTAPRPSVHLEVCILYV